MIDFGSLEKAVESLNRAIVVAGDVEKMPELGDDFRNTIRAGVIQNFEFTYEQCWKMLKRHMEEVSPNSELIDQMSYKDLMRAAAERGLIADPVLWFDYRDQRNTTSHTYNDDKAQSVFEAAKKFLLDAQSLLQNLKDNN